jgi:23S rRNA (cytidine2498-2'-O)-methyltransferase
MLPPGFRFVFVTDIFLGKLVAFPPSTRDRLAPLLDTLVPAMEASLASLSTEPLEIRVVAPESTAVAGLPKFCSGFENVLSAGIRKRGHRVAAPKSAGETGVGLKALETHEVFVIFFDYGLALAGMRPVHFGSRAHRRGRVPREKDAPSRSGSKLLEAWRFFELPQAAMRGPAGKPLLAVDLGAAPGGWSSVLAAAGYNVHAVDNGDLDKNLIAKYGQRITHLKKDAFHFAPEPGVSIVTCDIVERPAQVTDLLLRWLRLTKLKVLVFNLKLPMKKRYEEINRCLERLQKGMQEAGTEFEMDAHQLYHDRQEVTVVVRTLGS